MVHPLSGVIVMDSNPPSKTLAEQIKENFKPIKKKWEIELEKYVRKEFEKGDKFIHVCGCYGSDWAAGELKSFNVHSVSDWLINNGFRIVDVKTYGSGTHQFVITITF